MTDETSPTTLKIIEALYNAECGNCVFDALQAVPTSNLQDMWSMIEYILTQRGEKNDARFTIQ